MPDSGETVRTCFKTTISHLVIPNVVRNLLLNPGKSTFLTTFGMTGHLGKVSWCDH